MGIIRAIRQTIGGTLADQWLEVIEPENMGDQTVLTAGIRTGKGANRKGGKDSISNGSVIHVYEGQFMMLLDGSWITVRNRDILPWIILLCHPCSVEVWTMW